MTNLAALLQEGAPSSADQGPDWALNLSRLQGVNENYDALKKMKESPWAPWLDGATPYIPRTPSYDAMDVAADMLNRQSLPPTRTRRSY